MKNGPMDEAAIRRHLPFIDFETPVKVTTPARRGWSCRYCVAKYGLHGSEGKGGAEVFVTYEEWVEHFNLNHTPIPKEGK